jgi:hypothetical protein
MRKKSRKKKLSKDDQQKEYDKCKKNPIYFIINYCVISHPIKGNLPFKLFDYQKELVKKFFDKDYRLHQIVKSRQLGVSTLYSALVLWLILFYNSKTVAVVATDLDTAKELLEKSGFIYDNLPTFLRANKRLRNKTTLWLKNNSRIKVYAHNKRRGVRSLAASVIVMDEAHFIENCDSLWSTIQPSISTGGQVIALSSPAEPAGWFFDQYKKIENGKSNFKLTKLPWFVHPDRQLKDGSPNWDWRKQQDIELDPREARQEYDAEFGYSKETYFNPDNLEYIEKNFVKDPIRREYRDRLWIWEDPLPDQQYIIAVDCAEGGNDNNVVQVLKYPQLEQVAEYVSDESYEDFGFVPVPLAKRYNKGVLIIERNSVGTSIIQRSKDLNYHNIFIFGTGKEKNLFGTKRKEFGWRTTARTRPFLIKTLEQYTETGEPAIVRSNRLLLEFKTFISKNGKAQAKDGEHDDAIMAWSIALALYQIRGHDIVNNDSESRIDDVMGMMSLATERALKRYEDMQDENKQDADFEDKLERALNMIVPKSIRTAEKRMGIDKLQKLVNS